MAWGPPLGPEDLRHSLGTAPVPGDPTTHDSLGTPTTTWEFHQALRTPTMA